MSQFLLGKRYFLFSQKSLKKKKVLVRTSSNLKTKYRGWQTKGTGLNDKKEAAPARLLEISEYRKIKRLHHSSETLSWLLHMLAEIISLINQIHICYHKHEFIYAYIFQYNSTSNILHQAMILWATLRLLLGMAKTQGNEKAKLYYPLKSSHEVMAISSFLTQKICSFYVHATFKA